MDAGPEGGDLVAGDDAVDLRHLCRQGDHGDGEGAAPAVRTAGFGLRRRDDATLDGDAGGSADKRADRPAEGGAGSAADDHAPDVCAICRRQRLKQPRCDDLRWYARLRSRVGAWMA